MMEQIQLNDGNKIPVLGIGTYQIASADARRSVRFALENGYRLVDTANAYGNERSVGKGIKESGAPREDVFLSTKLWPTIYKRADEAIDETLERLGTDYIDLLFLHQAAGDYVGAYQAMERAVKAGKVKSLGLSNFQPDQIDKIRKHTTINPAVLQVETHPYYDQAELKKYLEPMGTKIMAWYPLGHGDTSLVNEAVFTGLGRKYGKSNVQVILRWHIQMGHIVIPGSKNEQHIYDNMNVFDFSLTHEEMSTVAAIHKNRLYNNFPRFASSMLMMWKPKFDIKE